jgi:hypothetical protein
VLNVEEVRAVKGRYGGVEKGEERVETRRKEKKTKLGERKESRAREG